MDSLKHDLMNNKKTLKDQLTAIDMKINILSTKYTNLTDEKNKLLNTSSEYNITLTLIENNLTYLHYEIERNKSKQHPIKLSFDENNMNLQDCNNLLKFFKDNLDISGNNIIGSMDDIHTFTILDKELIKEYIKLYNNMSDFNIRCYLTEIDLYQKFDKNIVNKAIKNWMDFHDVGPDLKQGYILNVINSSAGIHGWSK